MNWEAIQSKLQSLARNLRQNKLLDAAAKTAIEEIPVVGKFLSKYADSLGETDDAAKNMATFVDAIADQKKSFENLQQLIQSQGDELLAQKANLGEILVRVSETHSDVKAVQAQISRFVETLQIPSAREAFETAAAMGEDYRQSHDRIVEAETALRNAGTTVDASSFYKLGMLYLSMSDYDRGEACLLKAVEMQPSMVDGLEGLAMIYQLRATEYLQTDNFGLAEEAARKSEGYAKSALILQPTKISVQLHLGYLYKDMAERYRGGGNAAKANLAADQAWSCFEVVAKVNPSDPSAHNGLGDVCIFRSDFDGAIAHCRKALELAPNYLFAQFDLALAYYYKAQDAQETRTRLEAMKSGIEAYQRLLEIDGTPAAGSLPPNARESIQSAYEAMIVSINQSASAGKTE